MLQYIDLHTHSTASDGTLSPKELVRHAYENEVRVLALTDHDTVDGLTEAYMEGLKYGIEVIPGVELSAEFKNSSNGSCHILGYYVNYTDKVFSATLSLRKESRKQRTISMIEKLKEYGIFITYEDVVKCASSEMSLGRPHIARAMYNKGYIKYTEEAFDKYIGKGCPAYVTSSKYTARECISSITQARGIPILAHPLTMKLSYVDTEKEIKKLKDYGLMGIEVYYSTHNREDVLFLLDVARRNNLLITCGSDFHGVDVFQNQIARGIGDNLLITNMEIIEKLKRA